MCKGTSTVLYLDPLFFSILLVESTVESLYVRYTSFYVGTVDSFI